MPKKKRYTQEDDEVVIRNVENNPHNLNYSFELSSIELKRTPKSVEKRWYNCLRNNKNNFVTASGRTNYINTKNVWRRKPRPDMKVGNDIKLNSFRIIIN